MANSFTNTASAVGNILNVETALTAAVTVQLINGLTMTKTADQSSWAAGDLTFTLAIANTSGDDYTGVVIDDMLDPLVMTLVPGSVMLNGSATTNYTYDSSTGELILFPDETVDVPTGGSIAVTFRVAKV